MSVKALKRKTVSAISVSWSFGWVVCANRKLTLCTQDVQTENIQSSASFLGGAFLMYKNGNRFEYFNKLETMFDSNDIIFKCSNNNMAAFSRIIADYELKNIYEELIFYLFIEKKLFRRALLTLYCKYFSNVL